MKAGFVIFFSILVIVYLLINLYVFIRGAQALTSFPRRLYICLALMLSLSFLIGRFLEKYFPSIISEIFVWIGSFWIAIIIYLFLFVLLIDFLRMLNHFFSIFPAFIQKNYSKTKFILCVGICSFVSLIVFWGFINSLFPQTKFIELKISKRSIHRELKILAISDIHLGTIIGKKRLTHLVNRINELKPDIVLFPGDIIDEDIGLIFKQNLHQIFKKIKSKYGIYACTGNHEYIGGIEKAMTFIKESGITILRDSAIKIEESIYIIGREDINAKIFRGGKRKSLNEIVRGLDKKLPVIVMDHQPLHLQEAADNNVDLQISGHTHHGQMFPGNIITGLIFELSWGYIKKNNTHIYVTSGFGTWGPPVRLGNHPEIVLFKLIIEKY